MNEVLTSCVKFEKPSNKCDTMPSNCVICGNSAMKDPGVSFHRLPTSSERKRQWLTAFGVSEEEWCTHWRVCSRHFPDGNPKAAPHSYEEDEFATTWALRKRAKLDQSRISSSRQTKRNNLNSILAFQAARAALSSNTFNTTTTTTTSSSDGSSSSNETRTVHARAPPVLLPVASLAGNQVVSGPIVTGPIAVITQESFKHCNIPPSQQKQQPASIQHNTLRETTSTELQNVHVHELVVMPDVGVSTSSSVPSTTDDVSSVSSETDDSIPGLTSSEIEHSAPTHCESETDQRFDNSSVITRNHGATNAGNNHASNMTMDNTTVSMTSTHIIPGDNQTTSVALQTASMSCESDHSQRDVSVLVQGSLLSHIAHLKYDNQKLKEKSKSPLCVRVTDSSRGRPAHGIAVEVSSWKASSADWTQLHSGVTDDSGEYSSVLPQSQLGAGLYRIHFDTQSYYISQGHSQPHYPYVEVIFHLKVATSYHQVFLQLSPFSYTTSSYTQ